MSTIYNLNLKSALEVIKKINEYQNEYDNPHIKSILPKPVLNDETKANALKSTGFMSNGGGKWLAAVILTGHMTLIGIICLILVILDAIKPGITSITFGDDAIFISYFGVLALLYAIFLAVWFKKIKNKINSIEIAQRKCEKYKKGVQVYRNNYENKLNAERMRIKKEFQRFINRYSIPEWMLEYHKQFTYGFTSVLFNNYYSLSENTINNLYRHYYSHLEFTSKIDPLWLISGNYVSKNLIDIIGFFPNISTFKELEDMYVQILKVKKDFLLRLSNEFSKFKKSIENSEREEYKIYHEWETHETQRSNNEHKVSQKEFAAFLEKANRYYDRKETEAYYKYNKDRF